MNFRLKNPQQLWATVDRITDNQEHQNQEIISLPGTMTFYFIFLKAYPLSNHSLVTFFSQVICSKAVHQDRCSRADHKLFERYFPHSSGIPFPSSHCTTGLPSFNKHRVPFQSLTEVISMLFIWASWKPPSDITSSSASSSAVATFRRLNNWREKVFKMYCIANIDTALHVIIQ